MTKTCSSAFLWGNVFLMFWMFFDGWLCLDTSLPTTGCFGPCPDAADGRMCDMCFCERISDGPIKEPINTVSNVGFVLVGLVILWHMSVTQPFQRNRFTQQPFYGVLYGMVAIGIGGGSSAMHGSFSTIGGALDMASMFVWTAFVIAYNITRMFGIPIWGFSAVFVGAAGVAIPSQYKVGSNEMFVIMVVIALVSELVALYRGVEVISWRTTQWMLWTVLVFLVGFAVWLPSRTGHVWCYPDSVWQGHAFWHLTSAGAVGCCFVYGWMAPDRVK